MNKLRSTFCFVQLYHIVERGGGAEVQANYLATELSKRGHDVHYICRTLDENKIFSQSIVNDVVVHWLPNKSELNLKNLKSIYSLILKIEPNYVIERMSSTYGISIVFAKLKKNIDYIWICTDNLSPNRFKSVRNAKTKLSALKFLIFLPKFILSDFLRIISIKKSDVAFSQNQIQKTLIQNTFNKPSHKDLITKPFYGALILVRTNGQNSL
jgi:hypothetical protein